MRITVDRDRCVGAGQCVLAAPAVFDQDEDGVVSLLAEDPAPGQQTAVRLAGSLCPSRAITVQS